MTFIARYKGRDLIVFSPLPPRNGRLPVSAVGTNSQPHAQPVIVLNDANLNSKMSAEQTANGRTCAPFVVSSLQNPNDSAAAATVANDAKERPQNDGNGQGDKKRPYDGDVLPLNSRLDVPPIIGHCKHCKKELVRKSKNGRFPVYCSAQCRVSAYRKRQKEG